MNRPVTIAQALTGRVPAVRQQPFQFTCWQCGRDNGMAGIPTSVRCIGFGCDALIEASDNPLYEQPVSRLTLAKAE